MVPTAHRASSTPGRFPVPGGATASPPCSTPPPRGPPDRTGLWQPAAMRPRLVSRRLAHLRAPVVDSRRTGFGPSLPSGSNSAGRVSASQAECRGFESRLPLHLLGLISGRPAACRVHRRIALRDRTNRLPQPSGDRIALAVRSEPALGRSNAEIAAELVVSLTTVKWHVGNALGKLGVTSRTQALVQAQRLGLV